MELSRRDAVAALAAIGIGGGAVAYTQLDGAGEGSSDTDGGATTDGTATDAPGGSVDRTADAPGGSAELVETTVALADVLYPPEVDGVEEFVRTYVRGRTGSDGERRRGMVDAAATLDARARDSYDAPFRDLAPEEGDALLRELGMESVDPDPDGTERERVRFYLVNELLYALLTSPKGGQLVNIANPPGHPGGLDAYQQGPQA